MLASPGALVPPAPVAVEHERHQDDREHAREHGAQGEGDPAVDAEVAPSKAPMNQTISITRTMKPRQAAGKRTIRRIPSSSFRSPAAPACGRVCRKSLSKCATPALRVAYVATPDFA